MKSSDLQGISNLDKLEVLLIGVDPTSTIQLADELALYRSHVNLVIADSSNEGSRETMADYDFVKTRPLDSRFNFSHQVGNIKAIVSDKVQVVRASCVLV